MALQEKTSLTLFDKFLCGSFAGTTSQAIVYPLDVLLKTLLELNNNR